jgi:fluoride ion exporter CrcB/FEX
LRFLEGALSWGHLGLLGAFGGIANFYYLNATKNRKFVWGVLAANVILAAFLGKSLGGMISEENEFRDSIVMLLGFFAFPVVHALEARFIAFLDRTLPFGR